MRIFRKIIIMLGVLLASCNRPAPNQGLPIEVETSLNAGQPGASYQLNVKGSSKVYIVTQGPGYCGSGGCGHVVFIEEDGKLLKVFEGLAGQIDPNLEDPREIRLRFQFAGLACNKADNASPCEREMVWISGKLVERRQ